MSKSIARRQRMDEDAGVGEVGEVGIGDREDIGELSWLTGGR